MSTLHLVAPAYRDAASVIPSFDLDKQSVEEIRGSIRDAYLKAYGSPDAVKKEAVLIQRGGEPVRALLFRPDRGTPRGAILHIHGGGWVAGSADLFAPFCAGVADRHGVVVLSVDYRLVPEAAGDAALEDCFDALRWLRDQAGRLSFDPATLLVMGDSAGGNLAAGTALKARDGNFAIKAQLLTYPSLDNRTGGPEAPARNPFSGEFVLPGAYVRQLWGVRLSRSAPESLPYLAPARMEKLEGVAPAFITIGSLDVLVDEAVAYAGRLIRSGVPTELHVFNGVFHGFDLIPGPETDAFKADLARAIENHLA